MVCLTRGVIEETKQYMFNTTNNTCSIQKQCMFNTRHIRTWTRKLRASDVVPAQTLIGWYVCHFAYWLFGKHFGFRFFKSFAKRLFCGLKCHLNIATHGAWRSGLQSRGRYSFSIWIKELKEFDKMLFYFYCYNFCKFNWGLHCHFAY